MPNFFDQFDGAPKTQTAGNFFDQFDAPAAPAGTPAQTDAYNSTLADLSKMTQNPHAQPSGDEWQRATFLPFEKNTQTGEKRWAVPQSVEDVIDAIKLPGDAYSGAVDPLSQEGIGRAFNAATVLAGRPVATGSNTLLTESGTVVPKAVTRALAADKVPIDEVAQRVAQLGGYGTVADLGMNVGDKAAALATRPGTAQSTIVDALTARKAGAPERLTTALDENLGPATTPSYLQAEIAANKKALGPSYDTVTANGAPLDTADIVQAVEGQVPKVRGAAQSALQAARGMFNATGSDQLETDPGTLMQVRHALDGTLRETQNSDVTRVLTPVRQQLDAEIAAKVPDVKNLDAQYYELSRQGEAVDKGQTVLGNGRTDLRPNELNDMVAQGAQPSQTMIGPSAVPTRLRQGARAEIDRIVGTNLNDRAALNSLLKGESDWNYQRLSTLFGKDKTDAIYRVLDNERAMSNTENKALSGSKTSSLLSAKEEVNGPSKAPGVLRSAANLRMGDAAVAAIDKATGGLASRRLDARNQAMADALMSNGQWTDPGNVYNVPIGAIVNAALRKRLEPSSDPTTDDILAAIRRGS